MIVTDKDLRIIFWNPVVCLAQRTKRTETRLTNPYDSRMANIMLLSHQDIMLSWASVL